MRRNGNTRAEIITTTVPPRSRSESATVARSHAPRSPFETTAVAKKFLLACLLAVVLGAAAGFAMPSDAAMRTTAGQTY